MFSAGAQNCNLMRLYRYAEHVGWYRYVVKYQTIEKNNVKNMLSRNVEGVRDKIFLTSTDYA